MNRMNKIRSPLIRKAARLESFSQQFGRHFTAGVDEPKLTKSDDVKYHSVHHYAVEKTPITAQLWMQRTKVRESMAGATSLSAISHVSKDTTQLNDSAPTFLLDKTAKESRLTIRYKFSEDATLRDLYIDALGNILTGKLFEDLDALAGNVAFAHCDDNNPLTRPLSLVTARVNRIRQSRKISASDDLILTGQVVWVGNSSLDVLMEIHRLKDIEINPDETDDGGAVMIKENVPSRLLSSLFTYVARDRQTGKSCAINHFVPTGIDEEELCAKRNNLAISRKLAKKAGVKNGGNGSGEGVDAQVLHSLVERGIAMEDMPALASSNAVLMRYTALENSLVCQPQNVNMAGRVFGGYLMHRAYDLALATGYIFAGAYPHFLEVDQIDFKKPVDIGDLVRLKSRVVFTNDDPVMSVLQVEVTCHVVRPERAFSFVSNTFNFVFRFDDTVSLRRVLPSNREEAVVLVKAASWVNSPNNTD